jgi:hypothetical protein
MKIIFSTIVIILCFNLGFSQNYNDVLLLSQPGLYSDARALGMGNSFTSLSNDFAGVLFNPAGLGLMKKGEISGGLSLNTFYNNTTFYGSTTNADQTSVDFTQFGIAYPVPTFRGSLVFAIGYNQVKDFNGIMEFDGYNSGNTSMIQDVTGEYNYDEEPYTNILGLAYEIRDPETNGYIKDTTRISGLLNQSGGIDKDGGIGKWSFASSFEAAKGFYIGGTFNIITGSYESDSDYWEADTKDNYGINLPLDPSDATTRDFQSFYQNRIIDWDLSGWDFQFGILYNYNDKFRFGASVKFPSYITVEENFVVNAESYFGTGYEYSLYPAIYSPIEYEIRTPYEYTLGASASVSMITLAADIKIMDYTQMEFTEGFSYDYIAARQDEIDEFMTTTIDYHFGAEVKIPNIPVFGRAGFMYFQSPFDGDPDEFNKKYVTAGAGAVIEEQFIIDFAYTYGWWQDYGDNYGVNVSRTFQDINIDNMILTLTVRL